MAVYRLLQQETKRTMVFSAVISTLRSSNTESKVLKTFLPVPVAKLSRQEHKNVLVSDTAFCVGNTGS